MKVSDVPLGQGRSGVIGGQAVAVYRDEGLMVVLDIVCPHLGCSVDWDPREETWTCPCHLSRFTRKGDLLSGPAPGGLTPLDFRLDGDEILLTS